LSSTDFYQDCAMLDCTRKGAVQIPIERWEEYLLGCMGANLFRLDHCFFGHVLSFFLCKIDEPNERVKGEVTKKPTK
jgi:hypothetical protein